MKQTLERHRYKILVGVPIVVLLASSLSLVRPDNSLTVGSQMSPFLTAGATTTIQVVFDATTPINAVGGTILIPTDTLEVVAISTENSAIDLWSEQPQVSSDGSEIRFSGGIVTQTGFSGSAPVLTFVVQALKPGNSTITFTESEMLAHDGRGTNVLRETRPLTLDIRESSMPSPDVNSDHRVTITDFGIVSSRLFGEYESSYDLDGDGKISLSDLRVLVSSFLGMPSR